MGDEKKAIAYYRKALEIDPSLEAARDNLKLLGDA
jgi:tetratricopeptide (TPR) repeat protein